MIGRIDHDELLRLLGTRVELADVLERTDLVALAVDEELRLRAAQDGIPVSPCYRHRDADERRDARILGADAHANPRSERHPAGPHPRGRISAVHEIEAGAKIVHLAGSVAEGAGTFSRA